MAKVSKFMKLNKNILMEWIFDSEHFISENYKVITNLNENKKRSFLSTSNLNNINNNLFQLDSVLKKYTVVNPAKYNFLQSQDYNSAPTQYDTVRIYLPTSYNFISDGYIGIYLKLFAYGYSNTKIYELSNIFFDATLGNGSGITLSLSSPFMYDEQEWSKYYEFDIPSVDYVSKQRLSSTGSTYPSVWNNSINDNLTLSSVGSEGLSQSGPIFVDFQYINSKDILFPGTINEATYYYASEAYRTSFSKAPEYNTLAVTIQESTEGDFFEIYGTYGTSNENLDNFVREVENKGRKIRIEYDVLLYEENIQTNFQTIVVTGGVNDDFTKKLLYRPILTFSNTTAAITVVMRVIDLVDMSTTSRTTTIGINSNIQKYGKKLISLNVTNLNNLKIYNAKPDQITMDNGVLSGNITTEIIKVNSPQLIEVGKIIVNNPLSSGEYKGMGLLNLIITPFDNIIQFRLGIIPQTNTGSGNQFEQYDLSTILNNSQIMLTFKSDTDSVTKSIYMEADNDYKHGIINFKIVQNDISILRNIYSKGFYNFYLTIIDISKIETLLYSGTFSLYENITFVNNNVSVNAITDMSSNVIQPPSTTVSSSNSGTTNATQAISEWPKAGRTVIIYTKYKNTTI